MLTNLVLYSSIFLRNLHINPWAAGNADDLCNSTPLSEKGEVSPKGGDIPLKLSIFAKTLNVP